MRRAGHILVTVRSGEAMSHVPSLADHLVGAARPAGQLDQGRLDRTVKRWGGAFRALGVYASRRCFGLAGEQHVGFDDLEERLGFSRTYALELAESDRADVVIEALRELALVEAAAPDTLATAPFTITTPEARTRIDPWATRRQVRGDAALQLEPGDESVRVAVVDTGVALGHPEFRRRLLAGYDTVDLGIGEPGSGVHLVGDSRGRDFAPRDECGHGSHVAGIIAAHGWRIPPGLAGRALLLPIRVLAAALLGASTRVAGVGALSDINAGLKACIDQGAKVINMSFGTPAAALDPAAPLPHAEVMRYADHYGCILVAAAGNSGTAQNFYPAALPEVIAVGSVDAEGRRSSFSTYGPHLSLCAPGERVVSAGRRAYRVSNGTSHAAPFVAGAAALLVSRARRAGRDLDGADVRRLLTGSAAPLGGGGFHPETGHGLLDALAALRRLDAELAAPRPGGR